jgi:hypothetical protein
MNARRVVLVLVMFLAPCLAATAQDRLEPEASGLNATDLDWNYFREIRTVLLKHAAEDHLARMICLPAFEPEWVVTVVREDREDDAAPHTYFVEYVRAEKRLYPPRNARDVPVQRSRAALDPETAESLNRAWRRMLRAPRYPQEARIGADGEDYHFSRSVPMFDQGKPDLLAGEEQGKIWSPDEDSLCGELVSIGEALKSYAQAQPEDRQKVRSEIQTRVKRLTTKLDRRGLRASPRHRPRFR